jgi:hypothetical protein
MAYRSFIKKPPGKELFKMGLFGRRTIPEKPVCDHAESTPAISWNTPCFVAREHYVGSGVR